MNFDLTEVEEQDVKDVYSYLGASLDSQGRRKWRDARTEAWRFFEGEQWTAAEKKMLQDANMPDFEINMIAGYVRTKAALITDQKPRATLTPIGSGDDTVGQVLLRGMDNIWECERANDILYDLAIEHENGGMAYLGISWDKNAGVMGKASIKHLDPLSVHIDPLVKKSAIYDGRFLLIANRIPVSEAKARYGITDDDVGNLEKVSTEDGEVDRQDNVDITGDDYGSKGGSGDPQDEVKGPRRLVWEIEAWLFKYQTKQLLVDSQTGSVQELDPKKKRSIDRINSRAKALGAPFRAVEKSVRIVRHMVVVGKKIVDGPTVNPYGTDANLRPLVGLVAMPGIKTRGAYAKGATSFLVGPQRELNKRRIQAIHTISTQASSNIYSPTGGLDPENKKKAGRLNQVVEFNPNLPRPERLGPGTIGLQDVFYMAKESKDDMQAIAALPDAMQGKSDSKSSGKKVLALQEAAMIHTKPTQRTMESVIEQVGKILAEILIRFAPVDFWQRLVDPTGEAHLVPGVMQIVAGDVSIASYDLKIGAGSSLPANRMAKAEYLVELSRVFGEPYGDLFAEAVARYIDEPGLAESIRQRNQEMRQAKAMQMAAAAQQAMVAGAPGGPSGPVGGAPRIVGPPPGPPPGGGAPVPMAA